MLSAQKYVLFIEKSKLSAYQVTLNKDFKSKKLLETGWTFQNLPLLLSKIKKKLNKPFRILLSDEFVYTEIISIDAEAKDVREEVKLKAQERIPDSLDNILWDFKEVFLLNGPKEEKVYQVIALTQTFYEKMRPLLAKINFRIEAIEPLSLSLARYLSENNTPVIIINISNPINIIMVKNGLVLASDSEKEITFKHLKIFMNFVKSHFLIVPQSIYFCGNTKSLNLKNFEPLRLKTEIHAFDPVISLALKPDIKGNAEEVLNPDFYFNSNKNSGSNNIIKLIVILIILLFVLSGAILLIFLNDAFKMTIDNWLKNLYAILIGN